MFNATLAVFKLYRGVTSIGSRQYVVVKYINQNATTIYNVCAKKQRILFMTIVQTPN